MDSDKSDGFGRADMDYVSLKIIFAQANWVYVHICQARRTCWEQIQLNYNKAKCYVQ